MTESELSKNYQFVLLASRFELLKSGHFYWFTTSLRNSLKNLGWQVKTLSREFPESQNFISDDWSTVLTSKNWGYNSGEISPLKLRKLIENKLDPRFSKKTWTIIYTYELSFTLLAALILILMRQPNYIVAINMLESGFWRKFYDFQLFGISPLRSTIKRSLKVLNNRLIMYANKSNQAINISRQIEYPISVFPHISILHPKINQFNNPKFTKGKEFVRKILILTWTNDIDFVCKILLHIKVTKPEVLSVITVHTKNVSDLSAIREFLVCNNIRDAEVVAGTLESSDYISLFESHQVTLLPYVDEMHFLNGSGRVLDSLVLGRPVIVHANLADNLSDSGVNGYFTFQESTAQSVFKAISRFLESPFSDQNLCIELQKSLADRAIKNYSLENLLENIAKKADEVISSGKSIAKVPKLKYLGVLIQFQVFWFTLHCYESSKTLWRKIKANFKL